MPDWQAVNRNKEKAMKPRRVIVTIEMTTCNQTKDIRDYFLQFDPWEGCEVHQVQVNVIKPEKK